MKKAESQQVTNEKANVAGGNNRSVIDLGEKMTGETIT